MKRLFYHLLIFCITTALARGQGSSQSDTWIPVGAGDMAYASFAAVADDMLYVIHSPIAGSTPDDDYVISRWDGTSWEKVTSFDFSGALYSFAAYNGELYVGGYTPDVNGIPGTGSIARWDGSAWQSVGGGVDYGPPGGSGQTVLSMAEFNGKLVVSGTFTEIGRVQAQSIAQWDGSRWAALDSAPSRSSYTLMAHNGRLYTAPGGSVIAEWDGHRWTNIPTEAAITKLGVYKGEICALGDKILIRQKNQWKTIAKSESHRVMPSPALVEHNGELFVTGFYSEVEPFWTDGAVRWDGRQWIESTPENSYVTFLIQYRGALYAGGFFRKPGSNSAHAGVMRLCDKENCVGITGAVFHDVDQNCRPAAAESGLEQRIIEILPGPYYTTTSERGEFSCMVPPGDYTVSLAPIPYWNIQCPNASSYEVSLRDAGNGISGTNFPLTPESNIRDVRVSVASGPARPGFSINYTITYENVGTVPASGTVRFFHDPMLTFESAMPDPDRYSSGLAEWDFIDLPIGASRSIHVRMKIPQTTPRGSKLCARAEIDLHDVGTFEIDLRDSSCVEVTGSFDPNDIQVTPNGANEDGVLAETDSVLTYMIRFQNTGTDTAFKVVVVDTLAAGHAPASIRLGAASHPYSFTLTGKGVMTWTFDNIMLPDSNVNEKESHGYLKYSIRLQKGLRSGAEVPNRAGIYFDFNEPVITNTVISIIPRKSGSAAAEPNGLRRFIYPNPSYGSITIDAPTTEGSIIQVQNMLGQNVMEHTVENAMQMISLDLSSLPAGTYTVLVPLGDGAYLTEKIALVR